MSFAFNLLMLIFKYAETSSLISNDVVLFFTKTDTFPEEMYLCLKNTCGWVSILVRVAPFQKYSQI